MERGYRKEVARAMGFRKFFTNQLIEADLKTELRWLLEGHALKGNDTHYVRITGKRLQEEYEKAMDAITIDPANRLRKKVEMLTIEKSKVDLALSQIEDMKKRIGLA